MLCIACHCLFDMYAYMCLFTSAASRTICSLCVLEGYSLCRSRLV